MNTFDLTLDLSKQVSMEPLRLRQGDKSGTTVRATVYDHGELVSGSYTARIAMRHPGTGATYYRETGTFSNGVATFTIDEQYAATVTGRTTGYVQLLQGSTVIASTADFPVVILRDATEGAVPGEVYDSAIEDALAELDEATGRISVMVQEQVAEELAAHPEWTTTVQDNSVTDAKLVQTGGILARNARLMYRLDNLLTNALPEGDSATATDAAKTPLAGLSVYGRSVQDGTPTPSAPVPIESVEGQLYQQTYYAEGDVRTVNGVTITTLADGTFSCSGTSTAIVYTMGTDDRCYVEVPAGTYTALGSYNVRIATKDAAGGASTSIATNVSAPYVFTLDTAKLVKVEPVIPTAVTLSDTHVWTALFAGGNNPVRLYVPYGHAGLLSVGTNLVNMAATYPYSRTQDGITLTVNADGSITVSGGTVPSAIWSHTTPFSPTMLLPAGTYTTYAVLPDGTVPDGYCPRVGDVSTGSSITYSRGVRTFTLDEPTWVYVVLVAMKDTVANDDVVRIMLVRGSTAQPYQPYVESVTPVPLDGHVLRSLPDGTRDEVTVDERGHAVLVQRVGEVTLDGSETWALASNNVFYPNRPQSEIAYTASNTSANLMATHFHAEAATNANMSDGACKIGHATGDTTMHIFMRNASCSTAAEFRTWITNNPTTAIYPLATPVTHDLGWTDAIPLCGPDMTAQAVPTAPFALTYERDLNVTLARLEAAIAALA